MPEPFFRFFSLSQAMAAVSIILLISSLLKINLQYFNNIFFDRVPIILNFENWRSSPPLHFVLEPTGIVGPKHQNLELMTNNSQPRFLKMILVSQAFSFCYVLTYLMLIRDWLCFALHLMNNWSSHLWVTSSLTLTLRDILKVLLYIRSNFEDRPKKRMQFWVR